MKLLLDQNLSPRLVDLLADIHPDSAHVQSLQLDRSSDEVVWNYARQYGFTIVTKDTDFHERSVIHGSPPKIVWIRRGNCSTSMIEKILRDHYADIQALVSNPETSYLVLL